MEKSVVLARFQVVLLVVGMVCAGKNSGHVSRFRLSTRWFCVVATRAEWLLTSVVKETHCSSDQSGVDCSLSMAAISPGSVGVLGRAARAI